MIPQTKVVAKLARVVREFELDYDSFNAACKAVRKEMQLTRPKRGRKLPQLLTDEELRNFYEYIDKLGSLKHQIMLRLLFFTAVRVSELCNIQMSDVDIAGNKIFVERGKGAKDRYILFPESFKLALKALMQVNTKSLYLFESNYRKAYSTRRIQQLVKEYAEAAGITKRVHPHLFRHQMLTWLTKNRVPDSEIMLISGHGSKKSLEVYQHLALGDVSQAYQDAVKKLDI